MNRFGTSRKTATAPVSPCTADTIRVATKRPASLSAPASISSCEPTQETPSLFGEITSTTRSRRRPVSNAPSFATKASTDRRSLSDRLTKSLITLGLVKGITPRSVRHTSGLAIQAFASLPLDGDVAGTQAMVSSYLNDSALLHGEKE